jgi:hypothetical protein
MLLLLLSKIYKLNVSKTNIVIVIVIAVIVIVIVIAVSKTTIKTQTTQAYSLKPKQGMPDRL